MSGLAVRSSFDWMKIEVKLFRDPRKKIPAHQYDKSLELEFPERSKAADLMALLNISNPQAITAIMKGCILPLEERLPHGALVNIFHVMYSG